jgi:hypothetical protein
MVSNPSDVCELSRQKLCMSTHVQRFSLQAHPSSSTPRSSVEFYESDLTKAPKADCCGPVGARSLMTARKSRKISICCTANVKLMFGGAVPGVVAPGVVAAKLVSTVSNSIHNHCSDLNTNLRSTGSGAFNHHLSHQDEYETLYIIRHIYHVYHRTLQGVTFQAHLRPIAFLLGWTSPTIPLCRHRPTVRRF